MLTYKEITNLELMDIINMPNSMRKEFINYPNISRYRARFHNAKALQRLRMLILQKARQHGITSKEVKQYIIKFNAAYAKCMELYHKPKKRGNLVK